MICVNKQTQMWSLLERKSGFVWITYLCIFFILYVHASMTSARYTIMVENLWFQCNLHVFATHTLFQMLVSLGVFEGGIDKVWSLCTTVLESIDFMRCFVRWHWRSAMPVHNTYSCILGAFRRTWSAHHHSINIRCIFLTYFIHILLYSVPVPYTFHDIQIFLRILYTFHAY